MRILSFEYGRIKKSYYLFTLTIIDIVIMIVMIILIFYSLLAIDSS